MPFFRNFTYWIDKRHWKYVFLLAMLELSPAPGTNGRINRRYCPS